MSAIAIAVRERPILFSGEMVCAILDGTKTQTRRVVLRRGRDGGEPFTATPGDNWTPESIARDYPCPYGQPGDRLWVRETWASLVFERDWESGCIDGWHEAPNPRAGKIVYNADDHGFNDGGDSVEDRGFAWRPSIFMPRWASRLTLEITDVRVERVQEIGPNDARDEGVPPYSPLHPLPAALYYRAAFADLWNGINAARGYGWDANPWVWVLEFRRVES